MSYEIGSVHPTEVDCCRWSMEEEEDWEVLEEVLGLFLE